LETRGALDSVFFLGAEIFAVKSLAADLGLLDLDVFVIMLETGFTLLIDLAAPLPLNPSDSACEIFFKAAKETGISPHSAAKSALASSKVALREMVLRQPIAVCPSMLGIICPGKMSLRLMIPHVSLILPMVFCFALSPASTPVFIILARRYQPIGSIEYKTAHQCFGVVRQTAKRRGLRGNCYTILIDYTRRGMKN
jgi:hypothetical protein